jgi:hypothetical protein
MNNVHPEPASARVSTLAGPSAARPGAAGRGAHEAAVPPSFSSAPSATAAPAGGRSAQPPWYYVNNSVPAGQSSEDFVDVGADPDGCDAGGQVGADALRRRDRLALRVIGRRVSKLMSSPRDGRDPQYTLRKCGVVSRGDVRIKVLEGTGYAEGVVHCGSVWGCAVCAAKIRHGRAEIYAASAARWLAEGNTLLMVTFTFPHDMGMDLDPLWDLVSEGMSHLTSTIAWRKLKDRLGEVYYRRAVEQTFGEHGWHPHCHMLVYVRGGDTTAATVAVDQYFSAAWAKWVTDHGYRVPSGQNGVVVTPCNTGGDAGAYIVKTQDGRGVGNELARGDLKKGRNGGRTPFEILREAGTGDKRMLGLWWEFEQASKGRRLITQSQGLAAVLGEDEVTDQELADEEAGGVDVAEFDGELWAGVCARGLEAPVFEAAAAGGLRAVNRVLAGHGLGLAHAPPVGVARDGPLMGPP